MELLHHTGRYHMVHNLVQPGMPCSETCNEHVIAVQVGWLAHRVAYLGNEGCCRLSHFTTWKSVSPFRLPRAACHQYHLQHQWHPIRRQAPAYRYQFLQGQSTATRRAKMMWTAIASKRSVQKGALLRCANVLDLSIQMPVS